MHVITLVVFVRAAAEHPSSIAIQPQWLQNHHLPRTTAQPETKITLKHSYLS